MSDLGHEGSGAEFALGHTEKLIDYGYRAAHEMSSALVEAQRFPNDFDGIIAGSPGMNRVAQAAHKEQERYIPPAKLALIYRAVLQACDSLDGLSDGVLENPTRRHFDAPKLECKGPDTSNCLTEPQVQTAPATYSDVIDPETRRREFASEGSSRRMCLRFAAMRECGTQTYR